MDLFSCCWESQKPCFCPFAPSSVHSSICLCLFLHPLFLLVHYIKGFTWTVTKKVSCRSAWSPNVCVGARLWMCFCGLTGPSVWSVLRSLLFASTFLFSEVSSLECTAVSFACLLSKRTGCLLSLCVVISVLAHTYTPSHPNVSTEPNEWLSEHWNI